MVRKSELNDLKEGERSAGADADRLLGRHHRQQQTKESMRKRYDSKLGHTAEPRPRQQRRAAPSSMIIATPSRKHRKQDTPDIFSNNTLRASSFTGVAHVECRCSRGPPPDGSEYVACTTCGTLSHKSCILDEYTDELFVDSTACIRCRRRSAEHMRRSMKIPSSNAPQTPHEDTDEDSSYTLGESEYDESPTTLAQQRRQDSAQQNAASLLEDFPRKYENLQRLILAQQEMVQSAQSAVERRRASAEHLYTKVLWRSYCNLPNGLASPATVDATAMVYERGRMVPICEAPKSWVTELKARVSDMIESAGAPVVESIMGSDNSGAQVGEKILVPWRELAVWVLHHGSYKRKKAKLGLLAEVLGLVEKGTFWKVEDV